MSGGAYNYAFAIVRGMADAIVPRTPLRRAFAAHLRQVAEVMRAVEWCDSGDTNDDDADAAIRSLLHKADELNAAYEMALEAQINLAAAIRKAEEMGAES